MVSRLFARRRPRIPRVVEMEVRGVGHADARLYQTKRRYNGTHRLLAPAGAPRVGIVEKTIEVGRSRRGAASGAGALEFLPGRQIRARARPGGTRGTQLQAGVTKPRRFRAVYSRLVD